MLQGDLSENLPEAPSIQAYQRKIAEDMSTKWLSSNEIIMTFQNMMCGLVLDETTGEYKQVGERLVNEKGLRMLVSFIQLHSNPVSALSKLSEDRILQLCGQAEKELNRQLLLHEDEWGIEKVNKDMIKNNVMNFMFFSLQRAADAGFQKFIAETTKTMMVQSSVMKSEEAKQPGILARIFRRTGKTEAS